MEKLITACYIYVPTNDLGGKPRSTLSCGSHQMGLLITLFPPMSLELPPQYSQIHLKEVILKISASANYHPLRQKF